MTKYAKKNSKFLILLSFFICFALCFTVADFFSNVITIRAFNSVSTTTKSTGYSIYAISLQNSTSKSNAEEFASTIIKQNGAGYIWFDGEKYFVLASAYAQENDAKLVKTNLESKGFTPTIISLNIGEITFSGTYSKNEQTALYNAIYAYKTTFDTLYDISVELDTSVCSENEAKLKINELESDINKIKLNYDALFDTKLTTTILYIKLTLTSLYNEITALINFDSSPAQTYSSKIKATYIEALALNKDLAESVGN